MADPKGYYRVLGLVPAATHEEVADVYWRLEKEWRVGPNRETGGVARKRAMDDAFRVLGDPDRRVLYDAQCISQGLATSPAVAGKPIRCQICNRVAAQPRYLIFWGVVSRVYAASRRPTQGIFCAACARKVSWAATAATSLRGWWSPWGLVWAPVYGLRNVMGGQKPPGLESELAWRNALAFQRAGNIPLAAALAGRVASLKGPHSDEARRLQEKLIAASGKAPPKLLDPWKARPHDLIGRSLLLFLAPLLIVILAVTIGLSVAGGHGPAAPGRARAGDRDAILRATGPGAVRRRNPFASRSIIRQLSGPWLGRAVKRGGGRERRCRAGRPELHAVRCAARDPATTPRRRPVDCAWPGLRGTTAPHPFQLVILRQRAGSLCVAQPFVPGDS